MAASSSSSSLLRSAARAARRRSIRPHLPAPEDSRLLSSASCRRQSGQSLARRHLSSDDCGGRMDSDKKLYSMDDLLEYKRQFDKNKEEIFGDADISEHEGKEEDLYERMRSIDDKLRRCLDEQEHLLQEIQVQMDSYKKYDQVKHFLVAIPSFVCIGLILDKMHMFG
uniref:Uncharacterized protein n=1 Tax=Leersia perrieri TaxID=77586 RepID=A0A0D9XDF9_9ORYZ